MAFQQRAGVAEDLKNFVLCHRAAMLIPKFKVQSLFYRRDAEAQSLKSFFSASLRLCG